MRDNFNRQLQLLNSELTEMGELCIAAMENTEKIITDSTLTTEQKDEIKANVKHYEEEIDRMERTIEDLCMRLVIHEQPVASDLLKVSSAHKMISDMERIGDQACDIAELSDYIVCRDYAMVHIAELFDVAVLQLKNVVCSFTQNNLNQAIEVIRNDDRVDELFGKVKKEIVEAIKTSDNGESCIDLLMVAKYLERIGDHAVNIAEWVEYSVTGAR